MATGLRLTTHRTVLRDLVMGDLKGLHSILGDPKVTKTLRFESKSLDETRQTLLRAIDEARAEPRSDFSLGVARLGTDVVIFGLVTLGVRDGRSADVGYAFRPSTWGMGFATESVSRLLSFAFDTLELQEVTAYIGPGNSASIRLAERLGFRRSGRIKGHVVKRGAARDSLVYSFTIPRGAG